MAFLSTYLTRTLKTVTTIKGINSHNVFDISIPTRIPWQTPKHRTINLLTTQNKNGDRLHSPFLYVRFRHPTPFCGPGRRPPQSRHSRSAYQTTQWAVKRSTKGRAFSLDFWLFSKSRLRNPRLRSCGVLERVLFFIFTTPPPTFWFRPLRASLTAADSKLCSHVTMSTVEFGCSSILTCFSIIYRHWEVGGHSWNLGWNRDWILNNNILTPSRRYFFFLI